MQKKILENRYYNFLGIAKRAGKIVAGHAIVVENISSAALVILADNASERTKRKIIKLCQDQQKELVCYGKSGDYAQALGSKAPVVLAILDKSFSNALMNKFGFGVLFGGERIGES